VPLNNQLAPERRDWSYMVFNSPPPGPGVLIEEVTLDERIGAEAVALLIDPEPDDLLTNVSLNLNLKGGIAKTAYGPVLFLIWWIPPIVNGHPFAFYEQVMNPLNCKTSEVLLRLEDQTHLHVLLIGVTGQVLTVFEYPNTFGFDGIRAGVDEARLTWPGPDDFQRAQCAYERDYDIDRLLAETPSTTARFRPGLG
jgi:hypothetical protein